jgi:hypothetical protein
MTALQVLVVVLVLMCCIAVAWRTNHGPSPPPNSNGCYTQLSPATNCTSDIANVTIKSTLGCCAATINNDPRFMVSHDTKSTVYTFQVTPSELQPYGGTGSSFEGGGTKRNFYINVPKSAVGPLPFLLLFDSGNDAGVWDYNMEHAGVPSGVSDVVRTVANSYPVVTMGPAWKDHWYNIDQETDARESYGKYKWEQAPMAPAVANSWNVGMYDGFGSSQDMPYIKFVVNAAMSGSKYHCSNKCVVIAFSAGTAMASRAMQEFPAMKKVPTIIGAVLNDGGSYQCYAYDPAVSKDQAPKPFSPCTSDQGCCPNGFTEKRYVEDGTDHPPTLIQSPTLEPYADPEAAGKYFNALSSVKGKVMQLNPNYKQHGLDPAVAPIEIKFILQLLDIYKNG